MPIFFSSTKMIPPRIPMWLEPKVYINSSTMFSLIITFTFRTLPLHLLKSLFQILVINPLPFLLNKCTIILWLLSLLGKGFFSIFFSNWILLIQGKSINFYYILCIYPCNKIFSLTFVTFNRVSSFLGMLSCHLE